MEPTAMANKKSNVKKTKSTGAKTGGKKGGASDFDIGSPKPVRKQRKKK
jgi:hypothetical protein